MTLPLLPNVPLVEGDVVSPELMYLALNAPIRDGLTEYLGHAPLIADEELSNAAGSVKPRLAALESSLRVSQVSGLTLNVASGAIRLQSGLVQTIASQNISAPNNATSLVWVDVNGAIGIGTVAPVVRVLLARVVTSAGAVSALTDLRQPGQYPVMPVTSSIKVFGGTNATDKVCTANEVFSDGLYYFRNFTVPAGITIVIDKFAKIYCSANVSILGTINVTTASVGATGQGTVSNLTVGGASGGGAGGGSGSSGAGGQTYSYAAQPYGSGGGLGFNSGFGSGSVGTGVAGRGGGGLWIEASGTVTLGSAAQIIAAGSIGTAPGIVTGTGAVSGNGGGSGGLIYLSSLISVLVSPGATLDVRGGAGTSAAAVGASMPLVQPGGGGGGGIVVIASPSNNISGSTISLAGGLAGAPAGSAGFGSIGGGAGGGFGGAGGSGLVGSQGRLILLDFIPLGS